MSTPTLADALTKVAVDAGDIMRAPAPSRIGYGVTIGDVTKIISVSVTPAGTPLSYQAHASASVWDQVTVDGKHCGNRCGGVAEFSRIAVGFILSQRGLS